MQIAGTPPTSGHSRDPRGSRNEMMKYARIATGLALAALTLTDGLPLSGQAPAPSARSRGSGDQGVRLPDQGRPRHRRPQLARRRPRRRHQGRQDCRGRRRHPRRRGAQDRRRLGPARHPRPDRHPRPRLPRREAERLRRRRLERLPRRLHAARAASPRCPTPARPAGATSPTSRRRVIDESKTRVTAFLNIVGAGMGSGPIEQNLDGHGRRRPPRTWPSSTRASSSASRARTTPARSGRRTSRR